MCPRDSGMARESGIEQELTSLKQQYHGLREAINKLKKERSEEAMEVQEKLCHQWKILAEIRELVMLSIRESREKKENAGHNDEVSAHKADQK